MRRPKAPHSHGSRRGSGLGLQAASTQQCSLPPAAFEDGHLQGVGGWWRNVPKAGARRPGPCQRTEGGADLTARQAQSTASIRAAIGSQRPHPTQPSSFLRKTIKAKQRWLTGWGTPHHKQVFQPGHFGASVLLRESTACPATFIPRPLLARTPSLPSRSHVSSPAKSLLLSPQFPPTPSRIIRLQVSRQLLSNPPEPGGSQQPKGVRVHSARWTLLCVPYGRFDFVRYSQWLLGVSTITTSFYR